MNCHLPEQVENQWSEMMNCVIVGAKCFSEKELEKLYPS